MASKPHGNKGKVCSQETRHRIRLAKLGSVQSLETRTKRSESLKRAYAEGRHERKGILYTLELREKRRLAMLGNKRAKGHKMSETQLEKQRVRMIGNHYTLGRRKEGIRIKAKRAPRGWDGKISNEYLVWMRQVKNRDYWKCQISNDDCSGRVEAHHILRWRDFPELRYEIKNGITLCHFHHPRKRVDEERYVVQFQELVAAKMQ